MQLKFDLSIPFFTNNKNIINTFFAQAKEGLDQKTNLHQYHKGLSQISSLESLLLFFGFHLLGFPRRILTSGCFHFDRILF